jgi:glycosyltransferase involved in cell wall biosynthesis
MKILYIIPSYNIYGGTPKKTLDLLNYFKTDSVLYVYGKGYQEFKALFEQTEASIYEGDYGRNLFKHIITLLKIIDRENIDIVQTQFTMGEVLGGIIKKFRPHTKLVVAYVGSSPLIGIKKYIATKVYNLTDSFIYVSEYVKNSKMQQLPILASKFTKVIYNGTRKRAALQKNQFDISHPALVDIAGLTNIKNISVLIQAIQIIRERYNKEVYLYVAGDGPERLALEEEISKRHVTKYVHLLGYQENVGELINKCDIFAHPCYIEGFGIAVAEAMMASKPTIVAKAGALPELIENNVSGLEVDPFDAGAWAEAIVKMIEDKKMADEFGENAKRRAQRKFSLSRYVCEYSSLYKSLLKEK